MTRSSPALDVAHLPTVAFTGRSPLWWGAVGLIAIEASMFALFIASYFFLRMRVDVWPPPGVNVPRLFLPTVNLGIMILSCIPAYLASEAAKRSDPAGMKLWLLINILLALITVAIRWQVWNSLNYTGYSNAYGSIVFIILGFHMFDYVAGILASIVIVAALLAGHAGEQVRKSVDFDSYTWYFVVAIWIPLYLVIFVSPLVPKR